MAKLPPEQALDHARRDLDLALRTGGDTTAARAAVEAAEAVLTQSRRDNAARQAEDLKAREARISAEAQDMIDLAREAIEAEIAALLPNSDILIRIDPDPAYLLVRARENQQEVEEQRFASIDELSTLDERIEALENERAAIVERRRAGHRDDVQDAGRIGLIDIDLADLRAMAERQREALSALPKDELPASTRAWNASVASARADVRLALCGELERRLLATARSLREEAGGNIQRRWRPTPEFRTAILQGVL